MLRPQKSAKPVHAEEHNMTDNFPKYPATRETAIAGSATPAPAGRLQVIGAPVLEGFNSDSSFGVRGSVQSLGTDQQKVDKPAAAPVREISFGPFRLLPAQFLLHAPPGPSC
jgi:hypothetical protein